MKKKHTKGLLRQFIKSLRHQESRNHGHSQNHSQNHSHSQGQSGNHHQLNL